MKSIFLAAAAMIAVPAIAQTSGSTGTSSPTNVGGQGTPTETRNSATAAEPADQTTPAPADQTAPADQSTMPAAATPAPAAAPATESAGGYQPSGPAIQGGTPGATPTFKPAPSPSEAFPPPAPLDSYPVCKKGQFDHCTQGAGSTHSRHRK